MESKISKFSVKTVYKVVIVIQPPFVFLNKSTGERTVYNIIISFQTL